MDDRSLPNDQSHNGWLIMRESRLKLGLDKSCIDHFYLDYDA